MTIDLRRGFGLGFSLALLSVAASAGAQQKPFPHPGGYVAGVRPTSGATNAARTSYDAWKAKYLKSDCGAGLIRVDNSDGATFSEGMGYGMVLTAYFGDRTEFDGLWAFTKKNFNSNGLMGWHVTCGGFTSGDGGNASATDGDTDIGFALVVAVDQWGDAYRQPALDYLKQLEAHDFKTCSPSGRVMATNGDWDSGCVSENTSYFMPAYYRVFARFTGDSLWAKAADDAVAIWQDNANAQTGLIANEVDQNGQLAAQPKDYVDYNGCRVPWRAALDYVWHGTAGAKQVTDKMSAWVASFGIANLVDGYNTDGTPSASGKYTGMNPWVGGFTSGAMTGDQATLDGFFSDFVAIADDNGAYYGASLRSLYLLMLSGNQWEPGVTAGTTGDGGAPGNGGAASSTGGAASGTGGGSGSGSAAGRSGAGGASATGGASAIGGSASAAAVGTAGGTAAPASSKADSGNCGCRLERARPVPSPAGIASLVAFAALARAARKRRLGRRRS